MPRAASAEPRRTSSCQLLLPPSTIRSPGCSRSASWLTVDSVGSPAGTITHTARGASSLETRSSSDEAPRAPWPSAVWTACSEKSKATTSCSESRFVRWTMVLPLFPRPMKPICMLGHLPSILGRADTPPAAARVRDAAAGGCAAAAAHPRCRLASALGALDAGAGLLGHLLRRDAEVLVDLRVGP